jgi:hypothetical protein
MHCDDLTSAQYSGAHGMPDLSQDAFGTAARIAGKTTANSGRDQLQPQPRTLTALRKTLGNAGPSVRSHRADDMGSTP